MQSEQRPSSRMQQGQKLMPRTHGGGEHTPGGAAWARPWQLATEAQRGRPPCFLAVWVNAPPPPLNVTPSTRGGRDERKQL